MGPAGRRRSGRGPPADHLGPDRSSRVRRSSRSARLRAVLVLAATPIGRADDASPRLAHELATADVVAAEDTRRLARLAAALGVAVGGRVVSHFEGNEAARA